MKLYRKIMVLAIIGLFIGAGVVPSVADTNETNHAMRNVIIVDDEGDGDFRSIQNAVDAANSGVTIKVYSGTYVEHVCVDKTLFLIGVDEELGSGNDTGKPVIMSDNEEYVMSVSADFVNISNFIIRNYGGIDVEYGVELYGASHCLISGNNFISEHITAIYLVESSYNTLEENSITNDSSWFGITLLRSDKNTIWRNTVTVLYRGIGLGVASSSNLVCKNTINVRDSIGFSTIWDLSNKNIFKENNFFGNYSLLFENSFLNSWSGNYYADWPGIIPRPILGIIFFPVGEHDALSMPYLKFDWHPAREPWRQN